jgi:hypothetical protein
LRWGCDNNRNQAPPPPPPQPPQHAYMPPASGAGRNYAAGGGVDGNYRPLSNDDGNWAAGGPGPRPTVGGRAAVRPLIANQGLPYSTDVVPPPSYHQAVDASAPFPTIASAPSPSPAPSYHVAIAVPVNPAAEGY